jgi:hypothetical protein
MTLTQREQVANKAKSIASPQAHPNLEGGKSPLRVFNMMRGLSMLYGKTIDIF